LLKWMFIFKSGFTLRCIQRFHYGLATPQCPLGQWVHHRPRHYVPLVPVTSCSQTSNSPNR
jgi:hypothetical protein